MKVHDYKKCEINLKLNINENEIEIDFILDHFNKDKPIFARTIMTKKLRGQKEIFSKEQILEYFRESDYIDCRINAFPSYVEYEGIQRYQPDFIFIDIDKNNFRTEKSFNLALTKTLKNIKEKLDGHPTVLSTGGGFHVYQPINSIVLETIKEFQEFENPSKQFLKFAKDYLSNNKADKSNNPSFKSCLLRIPGTFNSKFLNTDNDNKDTKVKIIQKWDGKRPSIKYLLRSFREYLITQKINDIRKKELKRKSYFQENNNGCANNIILWIEKLLNTPISDYRKNSIGLILAPYLINIKKLSFQESFDIINDWLNKCDSERKLDFNSKYLIKYALNNAINKGIPPMKLDTLKERNLELYYIINN